MLLFTSSVIAWQISVFISAALFLAAAGCFASACMVKTN